MMMMMMMMPCLEIFRLDALRGQTGGRIKGLVEPLLEEAEEDFNSLNIDRDDVLKINEGQLALLSLFLKKNNI